MKNEVILIGVVIVFQIIFCGASCGDESQDPCIYLVDEYRPCSESGLNGFVIRESPVFNNSIGIGIPPYKYPAPIELYDVFGNFVEVNGDSSLMSLIAVTGCCERYNKIDKYPGTPTFEWNSIPNQKLIAVAIFRKSIELSLDGSRINNVEDIVWTWNSGLGNSGGSSGKTKIEYKYGRDVMNGQILNTTTQLSFNTAYFWAVWAWDESGIEIEYSSQAIPFVVEPFPLSKEFSVKQLEGYFTILQATRIFDGLNITELFPIKAVECEVLCGSSDSTKVLEYITFPNDSTGSIVFNEMTEEIELEIEGFKLYNIRFICDNYLELRTIYNGDQVELLYVK